MPTRITGLTSGLDTEALVSAMVMNYQSKLTKSQQAQTSLQYKMDALKSVNTDVYSLFSSVDKLRWSSAYSLKSTSVSDNTKAKVSASDSAVNGTQTLKITELAQAGYLTGGNVKSKGTLSESTKLSDIYTTSGGKENSFSGGSISVTVGGKETRVSLTEGMTAKDLVSTLKDAGVNASFDAANGRFFVSSKKSGIENDFKLVANDADGMASLKALGLFSADADSIAEYKKWAGYDSMTDDKWDDFVNQQFASRQVSYGSRASSYASQYNTAKSAIDYYTKQTEGVLDSFKDETGNRIYADSKAINDHLDMLKEGRDADARFVDYRTSVEDKDENGNVTGTHFEYDLDKMKAAVKDGTLNEKALEDFTKLSEDITKFENASNKLADNEKNLKEQNEKLEKLDGKVKLEYADDGTVSKAVALTEADGASWEAIVSEVDADNATARKNLDDQLKDRVKQSKEMLDNISEGDISEGAVRLAGADAKIILNGAEFVSSGNTFSINGLSIEATAITKEPITITTSTDTQGIYDKIKDFISQYNDVVNKLSKLYNADSAKGYDPLTDEQKDQMSETEIAKWETKIKDSILRRDSTLSGILTSLTGSMSKVFDIDGKNYSLSTFGIKTMGYFAAAKNEKYAFHIDGDADDNASSGNSDKLMAAIVADPDSVVSFFQKLSSSLYDSLNAKMKSTTLSSAYTIYNDKQMASEYSDYTSTIKKWQDKVTTMQDSYYKKFASMESTLSKLQAQTGQMSSFFGG